MPGVAAVPWREPRVVHLDTGRIQAVAGHRQSRRHTAEYVGLATMHCADPFYVQIFQFGARRLGRASIAV